MLLLTGWASDWWYTPESRERGTAVHLWAADYDLGAVHEATFTSPYRSYLLAHIDAMRTLRPEILAVEEPLLHRVHRYGVRPDRVWRLFGALEVCDLKTGDAEKGHPIQTALQAMALEQRYKLPARMWVRSCLYLKENGRWARKVHDDPTDFDNAREVVRACC